MSALVWLLSVVCGFQPYCGRELSLFIPIIVYYPVTRLCTLHQFRLEMDNGTISEFELLTKNHKSWDFRHCLPCFWLRVSLGTLI